MLKVTNLCKRYDGVDALRDVSISVDSGSVVCLLGPNGAGKTTLASCIAGLTTPDSGGVTIAGVDAVASPAVARQHLGLAPQDTGVYMAATVRENLELFAALSGLRGNARRRRAEEAAEALLLDPLLDRMLHSLSGGQQRRVHTAMALVGRPRVLILDEPTTGADVETRRALLESVSALAENGAAVLYTTHYLEEVTEIATSVTFLVRGETAAEGTLEEMVAVAGSSQIDLLFDRVAPVLSVNGTTAISAGQNSSFKTDSPNTDLARLLNIIEQEEAQLLEVSITRPGLEAAYLILTGERSPEVGPRGD